MNTSIDAISIRAIKSRDVCALLEFYESFSEADARFFKPWPFTEEAMTKHVADAEAGRAISLIAVKEDGSILGHAFIQNLQAGRSTGTSGRDRAILALGWARGLIRKWIGRLPRPRLGIGLHASARGTGLSRKLLQRLLGDARKMRLPLIALGVHKANKTARALYEKMGFQIVREISQQNRNDSYEMELDHAE